VVKSTVLEANEKLHWTKVSSEQIGGCGGLLTPSHEVETIGNNRTDPTNRAFTSAHVDMEVNETQLTSERTHLTQHDTNPSEANLQLTADRSHTADLGESQERQWGSRPFEARGELD